MQRGKNAVRQCKALVVNVWKSDRRRQ